MTALYQILGRGAAARSRMDMVALRCRFVMELKEQTERMGGDTEESSWCELPEAVLTHHHVQRKRKVVQQGRYKKAGRSSRSSYSLCQSSTQILFKHLHPALHFTPVQPMIWQLEPQDQYVPASSCSIVYNFKDMLTRILVAKWSSRSILWRSS